MHDDGMTQHVRDLANALWGVESALSGPLDPDGGLVALSRLRTAVNAAEVAVRERMSVAVRERAEREARTAEGRRLRRFRITTSYCGSVYGDLDELLAAVAGPGPFPGKVEHHTHAKEGTRYVSLTWRTGPIPRRVLEHALVAQGDRVERQARGWVRTGAVIAPDVRRLFGPPEGLPPRAQRMRPRPA